MTYQIAILKNETLFDHELWVKACQNRRECLDYDVIDLTANDWLSQINRKHYDLFLLRPPGRLADLKRLYDERVYVLHHVLGKPVYPSVQEATIYENKRLLRDWLLANGIPHPETFVFSVKDQALAFSSNVTGFPLVAKTSIGGSGRGVVLLHNREQLRAYVDVAFSKGISTVCGPRLTTGSLAGKILKVFSKPGFLKQRIADYRELSAQRQRGFVILQSFVPHDYEWRCVRIGESYFAHKKLAKNRKASGSLMKAYDAVPLELLDFIRAITHTAGINSVAIDVFEHNGTYLVNEVQCFFGQSDAYQMLVDGQPGRYRFYGDRWVFEPGDFNTNQSYDLRLEAALEAVRRKRLRAETSNVIPAQER